MHPKWEAMFGGYRWTYPSGSIVINLHPHPNEYRFKSVRWHIHPPSVRRGSGGARKPCDDFDGVGEVEQVSAAYFAASFSRLLWTKWSAFATTLHHLRMASTCLFGYASHAAVVTGTVSPQALRTSPLDKEPHIQNADSELVFWPEWKARVRLRSIRWTCSNFPLTDSLFLPPETVMTFSGGLLMQSMHISDFWLLVLSLVALESDDTVCFYFFLIIWEPCRRITQVFVFVLFICACFFFVFWFVDTNRDCSPLHKNNFQYPRHVRPGVWNKNYELALSQ